MSQVNDIFTMKKIGMVAYPKLVIDFLPHFEKFEVIQIS